MCLIQFAQSTGVVLSNHSIINNSNIAGDYVVSKEDDCIVLPLPLFHSFALTCGAQTMACKNVKIILTGYRYITKDVVDSIIKYNGTFLMATPTMLIDVVNYIKKNELELPSLKTILTGASAFPPELAKTFKETLPQIEDLRIGYGKR